MTRVHCAERHPAAHSAHAPRHQIWKKQRCSKTKHIKYGRKDAVDREFVYILGCPDLLRSFSGSPKATLGDPRGSRGPPWASMWVRKAKNIDFPCVFHGFALKTLILLGFFKGWTKKQSPISSQMCQIPKTVASKSASGNSAADPADLPDPPETHPAVQSRPWVPHAGGQDDGS